MKEYNIDFNLLDMTDEIAHQIMVVMHDAGVFERLLHDDMDILSIYENLKSLQVIQVGVNGQFAGFFSLEDLGEFVGKRVVEVHAYLMPDQRVHSKMLMEEMINLIFANTSFVTIVTSVCDRYPLIKRFIKMNGFNEFVHRPDVISFDGQMYGLSYYFHEKRDIPIVQE